MNAFNTCVSEHDLYRKHSTSNLYVGRIASHLCTLWDQLYKQLISLSILQENKTWKCLRGIPFKTNNNANNNSIYELFYANITFEWKHSTDATQQRGSWRVKCRQQPQQTYLPIGTNNNRCISFKMCLCRNRAITHTRYHCLSSMTNNRSWTTSHL